MFNQFNNWIKRRFDNPELLTLIFSIIAIIVIFWLFGHLLAPVLVSIVIAYLLDGLVTRLVQWKMPHTLAVSLVCLLFFGFLLLALFVLMPLVWAQLLNLINELPHHIQRTQLFLTDLYTRYPKYISQKQFNSFIGTFQTDFARYGKLALTYSLATLSGVIIWIVYLVLVPLMVFFILKDRDQILQWLSQFVPKKRAMLRQVWNEVNLQIGNYIRAKVLEFIIVGVVSAIAFELLGLNYAILLAVLVSASSLIPYVGAVVVTVPFVIVAYLQWGMSYHFLYAMVVYTVIMILDGNVLAPLLFSETLKIHALAVILAILIFGGIWGFWGVFFAIPLATVVKAVLTAWFNSDKPVSLS